MAAWTRPRSPTHSRSAKGPHCEIETVEKSCGGIGTSRPSSCVGGGRSSASSCRMRYSRGRTIGFVTPHYRGDEYCGPDSGRGYVFFINRPVYARMYFGRQPSLASLEPPPRPHSWEQSSTFPACPSISRMPCSDRRTLSAVGPGIGTIPMAPDTRRRNRPRRPIPVTGIDDVRNTAPRRPAGSARAGRCGNRCVAEYPASRATPSALSPSPSLPTSSRGVRAADADGLDPRWRPRSGEPTSASSRHAASAAFSL